MKIWQKTIAVISTFALLFNSIAAPLTVLAQEATPEPTPEATTQPTDTPTPTDTATTEATIEATATPEVTPDATDLITPTPSDQPTETQAPESSPTVQGPPTATPTVTPEPQVEDPSITTTIVTTNVFPETVQNNLFKLITDKLDYSPTETAIITGSNFTPDTIYSLTISSTDNPATSTTVDITTDGSGSFTYTYQLDGNYRPNYKVEVKDGDETISSTTFTDDIIVNPNPTTNLPSDVSSTNATLKGANGDVETIAYSFWVSTASFDIIPGGSISNTSYGAYSTQGFVDPVQPGASFSAPLTSALYMPAVTPNTTYYYMAWVEVAGGAWYHGGIQSFTTTSDTTPPTCTSGVLNGDDSPPEFNLDGGATLSNTVQLVLTCSHMTKFASSGTTIANATDLNNIKLEQDNNSGHRPSVATINGNELTLTFYANDGTFTQDIYLDAGALANTSNISNDLISIPSTSITDHAKPKVWVYYMLNPPLYPLFTTPIVILANQTGGFDFGISSTEGGNITYDGGCTSFSSKGWGSTAGNLTFGGNPNFPEGVYNACTITLTDGSSNHNVGTGTIPTFIVDLAGPVMGDVTITPLYKVGLINYISGTSTISAPMTDAGTGVNGSTCAYSLDGGNNFKTDSASWDGVNCIFTNVSTLGATGINVSAQDKVPHARTFNPVNVPVTVDATAPVLTPPSDVKVESLDGNPVSVAIGTATATDNSGSTPTITNNAPATFPVGTTIVNWTATDFAGNSSTATQKIIITIKIPGERLPMLGTLTGVTLTPSLGKVTIANGLPATVSSVSNPTLFAELEAQHPGSGSTAGNKYVGFMINPPVVEGYSWYMDDLKEVTPGFEHDLDWETLGDPGTHADGTELWQTVTVKSGDVYNRTFRTPKDYEITWIFGKSDSPDKEFTELFTVEQTLDTIAPTIASHGDITIEATGPTGAVVTYTSPATSDNIDPAGTATCSPVSGSIFVLGDTTVTCNTTDAAGNHATPTTFVIHVIDTTAPTYTWNAPAVDSMYANSQVISVDASITESGSGITNGTNCYPVIHTTVGYFTGSVTYSTATGKCTGNITLTKPSGLADGAHYITLQVADKAGNSAISSNRNIVIDNTDPTVVLTDDHPDSIVRDADTVVITATFTEADQIDEVTPPTISINSVPVLVSSAPMTKVNNLVWTYTWDVPSGSNGTHTVSISAKDRAGNSNAVATGKTSYTIDNIAPTTTPSVYSNPYHFGDWTNGQISMRMSCNDGTGSGCAGTFYCVDQSDTCVPTTPYSGFNVNTEGTNYVRFYSTDNAGNSETVKSVSVLIDLTKPITNDDYGAKDGVWQNSNQTITLTASDSGGSGLQWTKYCFGTTLNNGVACYPESTGTECSNPASCSISVTDEEVRYITYVSQDIAGTRGNYVNRLIKIDKTVPTISFTQDVDLGPTQDDVVIINVSDTNPDISSYYYGFYGDSSCADVNYNQAYTSGTAFSFTDESHNGDYICVKATDSAGNNTYTHSGNPLNIDITAPLLTSAMTKDIDGDGKIDAIELTFDENINDSMLVAGADGWDVVGFNGESIGTGDVANDNILLLSFDENLGSDSGSTPTVTYTKQSLFNSTHDLAGNQLESLTYTGTTDASSPVLLSAETQDTDGNGKIDAIKLTFSENIDDGKLNLGTADGWDVEGYSEESIGTGDVANDNILILTIDEGLSNDDDITPTITYTPFPSKVASTHDMAGNQLAYYSEITTDSASPKEAVNNSSGEGDRAGEGDGLGCANHDCSIHPSALLAQVLGANTWPKLAYAGTQGTDNNVLGTETTVGATPSATIIPTLTPQPEKTSLINWIFTHKKISLGIVLILIVISFLIFKKKKK